ncbi:hypothetical protein ACL9RI_20505 [Janthinobacterium sp. Mn2066]|uniref:hypothetical protein n=1 Tax=Janthinobacterium sp. Mn2066 TaxID=3395264 RepID=UPI003BC59BAB
MARRDESGLTPISDKDDKARERGLSAHILPTSATMIGVCMTVLSIGHLGPRGELRVLVDKLLAADALLFLVSAVLSFMSLRPGQARQRYEWWGELVFICSLAMLALGAVVLAFLVS